MAVFFEYIDFGTNIQAKDFESAMQYNHSMQLIGTPEEKKNAEEKLIIALGNLMSLRS